MPPKARITREMILEEAFHIARTEGADKITARSISLRLGCSTQPVLYCFATVEEIRRAVYERADAYHGQYLMTLPEDCGDPLTAIGMNYVRFAVEEPQLFRLLFQTDSLHGASVPALINQEEIAPVCAVIAQEAGVSPQAAREIFMTLFIFVHGYASLHANNAMPFDAAQLAAALKNVFCGAVGAAKGLLPQ